MKPRTFESRLYQIVCAVSLLFLAFSVAIELYAILDGWLLLARGLMVEGAILKPVVILALGLIAAACTYLFFPPSFVKKIISGLKGVPNENA